MPTAVGRRGGFLVVALLLLLSILLEHYLILPFLPWFGGLGGVRLMFVIFDIPVRLPVIDWAPVGFIFLFFYAGVTLPVLRRREASSDYPGYLRVQAGSVLQRKLWVVFARWWLLLGCLLAGGAVFYLLKDHLTKAVRNGIDSFGVRADILLPYPSEETIHLEGGLIMLIFFIVGWRMLVRKTELGPEPAHVRPEPALGRPEQAMGRPEQAHGRPEQAQIRKRIVASIPEPVELKIKPPGPAIRKPCAPVPMPETTNRRGGVRPCVVEGEIKPA
jgi:hypothetical protein